MTDWPYGEMGIGVTLVPEAMSAKEAAKRTTMYKNHAFEEYVSELISLDRYLLQIFYVQSFNLPCHFNSGPIF